MDDKQFLEDFIDIFQAHPALWNYGSDDYKNEKLKDEAYSALLKRMQMENENATIVSVKSKINSLRASFRREFRKVQNSMRTGSSSFEIYKPKLWYYSKLEFLAMVSESEITGISSLTNQPGNKYSINSKLTLSSTSSALV